jgi:uncharacterized protein (DUF927 family)
MIATPLTRVKLAFSDTSPAGSRTSPEQNERSTPIIPVPADVEAVERAAARLMKRPADFIWRYLDEFGRLLFAVARWNEKDNDKTFRPLTWVRRPDGRTEWALQHLDTPRPLYGLDQLAASPSAPLVVVEGEKSADAARAVFPQSVVVTSPNGSNSAADADWSVLHGRPRALVWGDADEAGEKYALDVTHILSGLGVAEILIVNSTALASITLDGGKREPKKGWDVADAITDGWSIKELRKAVFTHAATFDPGPSFISFGAFQMTANGLTAEVRKGKGVNATTETVWVCRSFEVVGRARDPSGEGWARWLRWRDDDGRLHTHAVADAALHGDLKAICSDFAHKGLIIAIGRQVQLARYLNQVPIDARVTVVKRTGWHEIAGDKIFVLPEEGIGSSNCERVILDGAAGASPYQRRGTLEDWKAGIGNLVAGHSRPLLAVSMAFAGPLLSVIGVDGGGINFYGQSSRGKSTCGQAAASVWGRGASPGFVRSWRSTANALEGAAAVSTDTLLVLDELGVVDAREAVAGVYQLAAGTGKGRSARDGSLRTSMTWRVMTLSTGELPMSAKVAEDRGRRARAGQQVRLLDIPADAGRGFGVFDSAGAEQDAGKLADAIKRAAQSTYGTAGPAFVRKILDEGFSEIGKLVDEMIENFKIKHVPARADGQVQRAADRLGLIAAAGELATEWAITPWQPGAATSAAAEALSAWIDRRGGAEAAEVKDAIAQIRHFIELNGEARFDPIDATGDARGVQNRAGWRRTNGEHREWLILPETWKTEICAGYDSIATARALADRGMLNADPAGKFQRSERTPYGSKRVYVVTSEILEGSDHAQ